MKKTLYIFIIALILMPFVSVAENSGWENLLTTLENSEEYSNTVQLIETKLEQAERDGDLDKLSWEPIH